MQNRDVYSAAMVMFHALSGCCPFISCLDRSQVNDKAQTNRNAFGSLLPLPTDFPPDLKRFFKDCWDQRLGSALVVRCCSTLTQGSHRLRSDAVAQ